MERRERKTEKRGKEIETKVYVCTCMDNSMMSNTKTQQRERGRRLNASEAKRDRGEPRRREKQGVISWCVCTIVRSTVAVRCLYKSQACLSSNQTNEV